MVKKAIRLIVKIRRRIHQASARKLKDRHIISKLATLDAFKKSTTVLFYAPIPHEKEVDTWPLMQKHLKDKIIVLPRIIMKNKQIQLHVISDFYDIEPNPQGIPEPMTSCKTVKPEEIDLVIVPGIAFDKRGNRIGFGYGFYDRLLKKLSCPKIALAYDFQILHAIPRHSHDVAVDTIITEKKIYHIT